MGCLGLSIFWQLPRNTVLQKGAPTDCIRALSKNNTAKVFAWNMRISSILILFLCNSSVTFLQSRIDEAQHNLDDSVEPADTCAALFGDEEISVCQAVSGHSRFTVILRFCFYLLQKIFLSDFKERINAAYMLSINRLRSG